MLPKTMVVLINELGNINLATGTLRLAGLEYHVGRIIAQLPKLAESLKDSSEMNTILKLEDADCFLLESTSLYLVEQAYMKVAT